MIRRDATWRARALVLVLGVHAFFFCSRCRAAETESAHVSPDVLRLWQSSQALTSRSRMVRRDSKRLADHYRKRFPIPRQEDARIAESDNFRIVATVGGGLAQRVLDAAEEYRRDIALAWLGQELPAGNERTIIHVEVTDDRDIGLAMLDDGRTELRNRIWLQTSREKAVDTTLAHEMAHIVLSAKFPRGMPVWATEGVSCQYDDEGRIRRRRLLLRQFVRSGRWPSLTRLLNADVIVPTDEASYAAAVSLVEFLVTEADRATFLRFVADGHHHGWDTALSRHYRIRSIEELESQWRAAVTADFSMSAQVTTTLNQR